MKSCSKNTVWGVAFAALIGAMVTPAAADTEPQSESILVEQFEVDGNSLLSPDLVDQVLSPFKGPQDLTGLKRAAAALQNLYREIGYGAVVVYVPPQSGGSRVKLAVLEGRVQDIDISGESHFSEANIRASLPSLQPGQTPLVRQIDAEIQMANENPAKQIQVLLQPGQNPGEVAAKVTVVEQPLQRWSIRLDNTGNERTGLSRAALSWQYADLTGADDVVSLMYLTAPEQPADVKVFSAGYRLPLYKQRAAFDAYLALSDMDGGSAPTAAGNLEFSGKGQVAGLKLTRYLPRLGEVDQRITVGAEYRHYDNQCAIAGLPDGACGTAGASVASSTASIVYAAQTGGRNSAGLNINLVHNLGLDGGRGAESDFAAARPDADVRYTLFRANAFFTYQLPFEWGLNGRFAGQWTDDALIPGEQFGAGGAGSVRGYEERDLSGDLGASATAELFTPDLSAYFHLTNARLRLLAFADAGWVANRWGTSCAIGRTECAIESIGFGARLATGRWEWSLDFARALQSTANTLEDDERLHIAVNIAF